MIIGYSDSDAKVQKTDQGIGNGGIEKDNLLQNLLMNLFCILIIKSEDRL